MVHNEDGKYVSDSQVETVHVIMPEHLNGHGTLFGGQLAAWIDLLASIVATRHSGRVVTTAVIDNLRFRKPVFPGNIVVMKGRLTYVGTTSMEVRVDSYSENRQGDQHLVNTAFVTLVALDDDDKPTKVPPLILRSQEEMHECENGAKRREVRLQGNKDYYQ